MRLRSVISSSEKVTEPGSPKIHFITEHVDKITPKFPLWWWAKLTVFYMTKTYCVCKLHVQNITHWWDKNSALSYQINRASRRLVSLYPTLKVNVSTFRPQNHICLKQLFFLCAALKDQHKCNPSLHFCHILICVWKVSNQVP